MMTATQTFVILDREFEVDELKDVANHGMSGGVSGFIYSTELADIYDKHEDTILDLLDTFADDLGEQSGMAMVINSYTKNDEECHYTMQDIKEHSVWMYVEVKAYEILVAISHPDFV
jgi:hypothetical protein